MKYNLILTSYNVLEDNSLQLRNNWIERCDDVGLLELLKELNIPDDFKYPPKISISDILEGTTKEGVKIHMRIVVF